MKELITYPLNDVDYSAEDAGLFHCTRKSGVWYEDSFPIEVSGADNTIFIGKGLAWFSNTEFWGKVAAQKTKVSLDLEYADPVYDRIDVVALQFDANKNATNLIVKKGEAKTNPTIPSISRTEAVYELYLYAITRPAASLTITSANVRDLRLDDAYCGLMADSVTSLDFPVVPIEKGGTGATTVANARKNLNAASLGRNVFTDNQFLQNGKYLFGYLNDGTTSTGLLGVSTGGDVIIGGSSDPDRNVNLYGILNLNHALRIEDGGTGATDRADAISNLLALPTNTVPSEDTSSAWEAMGTCKIYFNSSSTVINKPTYYGTLLNFVNKTAGVVQLWFKHGYGDMFVRAGNATGWNNGKTESGADAWKPVYTSANVVPIENGGTGATTAENALKNLGISYDPLSVGGCAVYSGSTHYGVSEILKNLSKVRFFLNPAEVLLNLRVKISASTKEMVANKWYMVARFSSVAPEAETALSCISSLNDSARMFAAYVDSNGDVWVKPTTAIDKGNTVNVSITGVWTKG